VQVVDKDGTTCPPMSPMGVGNRRTSFGMMGKSRLGMPGVGQRRRQSMDDEDEEGG
jgi:hypothetical protein